jgi:hypothetical protein
MHVSYQITNEGVAMESLSLFSEIFGITDVIILAVFLVAIGIGVRVAFRQSRHDYGDYGP